MKIDVMKFDGTNNFEILRWEVLDAQNLEDTVKLQKRSTEVDDLEEDE